MPRRDGGAGDSRSDREEGAEGWKTRRWEMGKEEMGDGREVMGQIYLQFDQQSVS